MMPLSVELRLGVVTAFEVLKSALTFVAVAILVVAGATLLPFFAAQVAVGAAVVALTPLAVGWRAGLVPGFDRAVARELVREALPLAVALAMNVVYFRVLVIMTSLLASEHETGIFGTSFRVFEVVFSLPLLVLSTALPLLAVAGRDDDDRLRFGLQRMTEVGFAAATALVLAIVVLAPPAIRLLGGAEFEDAAGVLRIQAFALLPVFVGQTVQLGLLSVRRQSRARVGERSRARRRRRARRGADPGVGRSRRRRRGGRRGDVPRGAPYASLRRARPTVAPRVGLTARVALAAAAGPRRARAAAAVAARARRRARRVRRRGHAAASDPARAPPRAADAVTRPRVVLLRGHSANPWDLRPWELLRERFDVRVLATGSNAFDLVDARAPGRARAGRSRPAAARPRRRPRDARRRRPLPRPRGAPPRRRRRARGGDRRPVQPRAGAPARPARVPARPHRLGDDPVRRRVPRCRAAAATGARRCRASTSSSRRPSARGGRSCSRVRRPSGSSWHRRASTSRGSAPARAPGGAPRPLAGAARVGEGPPGRPARGRRAAPRARRRRAARVLVVGAGPERERLRRVRRRPRRRRSRRVARVGSPRRDAARLRARLGRRAREPSDGVLGGAVRDGARGGARRRRARPRRRVRRDPGGARAGPERSSSRATGPVSPSGSPR